MEYIASAFSLSMVADSAATIEVTRLGSVAEHKGKLLEVWDNESHRNFQVFSRLRPTSVVGHEGTAQALTTALGHEVAVNRQAVSLSAGDILWVAQPTGARLAPGTELAAPDLTLFRVEIGLPISQAERTAAAKKKLRQEAWDEFYTSHEMEFEGTDEAQFVSLHGQFEAGLPTCLKERK